MVCAVDQCLPAFFSFLVLKNFFRSRGIVGWGGIEYLKLRNCFSVLNCKLLIKIQGKSTKDCNFY